MFSSAGKCSAMAAPRAPTVVMRCHCDIPDGINWASDVMVKFFAGHSVAQLLAARI
jgi:hypothetical protein